MYYQTNATLFFHHIQPLRFWHVVRSSPSLHLFNISHWHRIVNSRPRLGVNPEQMCHDRSAYLECAAETVAVLRIRTLHCHRICFKNISVDGWQRSVQQHIALLLPNSLLEFCTLRIFHRSNDPGPVGISASMYPQALMTQVRFRYLKSFLSRQLHNPGSPCPSRRASLYFLRKVFSLPLLLKIIPPRRLSR